MYHIMEVAKEWTKLAMPKHVSTVGSLKRDDIIE